jgi:hypothetical protein
LISLISAILVGGGTITLAIMTWRSIRQTRGIQKNERRERLLNEIIEWAIDICRCGLKPFSMPTKEKTGSIYLLEGLGDLSLEYESISGRTEYISSIAPKFGESLEDEVHGLAKFVEDRTKLIDEQIQILRGTSFETTGKAEITKTSVFKEWLVSKAWAKGWPKYLSESFIVNLFKMEMNRTVLLENARQVIYRATDLKTLDIN